MADLTVQENDIIECGEEELEINQQNFYREKQEKWERDCNELLNTLKQCNDILNAKSNALDTSVQTDICSISNPTLQQTTAISVKQLANTSNANPPSTNYMIVRSATASTSTYTAGSPRSAVQCAPKINIARPNVAIMSSPNQHQPFRRQNTAIRSSFPSHQRGLRQYIAPSHAQLYAMQQPTRFTSNQSPARLAQPNALVQVSQPNKNLPYGCRLIAPAATRNTSPGFYELTTNTSQLSASQPQLSRVAQPIMYPGKRTHDSPNQNQIVVSDNIHATTSNITNAVSAPNVPAGFQFKKVKLPMISRPPGGSQVSGLIVKTPDTKGQVITVSTESPDLNKIHNAPEPEDKISISSILAPTKSPRPILPMPSGGVNNKFQSTSTKNEDTVDLTADEPSIPTIVQDEIPQFIDSVKKNSNIREKTYPSLVVTIRANWKKVATATANNERFILDTEMRKVLQLSPTNFTEHLLKQRLLRPEQKCEKHGSNYKLGVYTNLSRFPNSGGYVWISSCCSGSLISVFTGSIFDKTKIHPNTILKLIYHWACNTAVHNILSWVKVDSVILKTYFTYFRAVCTATVHHKMGFLGGENKKVLVAVIGLDEQILPGPNGVKFEILAAVDIKTHKMRLLALDNGDIKNTWPPEAINNWKLHRRFKALLRWVNPSSIIITNFPFEQKIGRQYGYNNAVWTRQSTPSENITSILDYLTSYLPKIFEHTGHILPFNVIQQFLDELVWRETWGTIPSRAFEHLSSAISEMTKLSGPDLISKLRKIAADPFKDWKNFFGKSEYDYNLPGPSGERQNAGNSKEIETTPAQLEPTIQIKKVKNNFVIFPNNLSTNKQSVNSSRTQEEESSVSTVKKQKDESVDVSLDEYYYGYLEGDSSRFKGTGTFIGECVICKSDFLNGNAFTNHLILHALNANDDIATEPSENLLAFCRQCCVPVTNIVSHIQRRHTREPTGRGLESCKICNTEYSGCEKLVKHMREMHHELEMPYVCEVCHFRTSIFNDMTEHYSINHGKGLFVQCPFCLKTVRIFSEHWAELPTNQYYFMQHIQKHMITKINKNCEMCILSFTNEGSLRQHQEQHHGSNRGMEGVKQHVIPNNKRIVIKRPLTQPEPPIFIPDPQNSPSPMALLELDLDPELEDYTCIECDGPIIGRHYSKKSTCTRCKYQTCCFTAMRHHVARCHITVPEKYLQARSQIIGCNPSMGKTHYCSSCTFSTSNGNLMASHLSQCDPRSSATSEKRRQSPYSDVPLKIRKL